MFFKIQCFISYIIEWCYSIKNIRNIKSVYTEYREHHLLINYFIYIYIFKPIKYISPHPCAVSCVVSCQFVKILTQNILLCNNIFGLLVTICRECPFLKFQCYGSERVMESRRVNCTFLCIH
jgi:hypothetical protein